MIAFVTAVRQRARAFRLTGRIAPPTYRLYCVTATLTDHEAGTKRFRDAALPPFLWPEDAYAAALLYEEGLAQRYHAEEIDVEVTVDLRLSTRPHLCPESRTERVYTLDELFAEIHNL